MGKEPTVARETELKPVNAIKGSPFGEVFDRRRDTVEARREARLALNGAKTPRLYGKTEINLGRQGSATVTRTGTERRGLLQITLNGQNISSVDYNEDALGFFRKTADDAFKEVKRRIGYYIYT